MGLHPCAGGPEMRRIKIYRAVENGLKREKINEGTGIQSFFRNPFAAGELLARISQDWNSGDRINCFNLAIIMQCKPW